MVSLGEELPLIFKSLLLLGHISLTRAMLAHHPNPYSKEGGLSTVPLAMT